jgi:putative copper export protein
MRAKVAVAASFVALVCAGTWLGGMLVLGALVAPVVFRMVPAPTSGDAMSVVFLRFDRIAVLLGCVLLLAEAALTRAAPVRRALRDRLRLAATLAALSFALYTALVLAPGIAALHAQGAVRGVGEAGLSLDRLHDRARWLGQAQALLLLAVIGFHAELLRRRGPPLGAVGTEISSRGDVGGNS